MSNNDERRDKRVQASLKVRYKSATVNEFIEKHSHDISPGGVFIRSKKPLAKGTLLKIDFRLEDDSAVIQGVGRVVWTREEDDSSEKPPGMGIKFIRLDENSKENLHKIITVQKSGEKINRASVFGEEPVEDQEEAPPEGKQVRDSVAPSLDVKMGDDSDTETMADVDSDDEKDDNEVTKKISVSSKSESSSKTEDSIDKDGPSKKASASPPSASPPIEDNERNSATLWMIILLIIVLGALTYYFVTSGKDGGANSADDSVDADVVQPLEPAPEPAPEPASEPAPEPEPEIEQVPEPEPEPVGPISGEVNISTEVEGATVLVDGEVQSGTTPLTIASLPAGDHQLVVKQFGYKPVENTITLEEGAPFSLKLTLPTARFVIQIKANVKGAKVFVGEKQIGRTPIKTVKRMAATFEFVVKRPKYQDLNVVVAEEDWRYEKGVYSLLKELTLVEEIATPSEVPVVAAPKAPPQRVSRSRRVKPATPKVDSTKQPSSPNKTAPAVEPSSVDNVKTEPAAESRSTPAAKPAVEEAPKPVVKAAGAAENPY